MRRFAIAAGLILSLAAAESQAGYYIVRIVLEGGSDTGTQPEIGAGPAQPVIPSGPPPGAAAAGGGGRGGTAGGGGERPSGPSPVQPTPGTGPNPMTPTVSGDPYRSIVVVVPFDKPFENRAFYPKVTNVMWPAQFTYPGGRTNLFDDQTTYQLITKFQDTPPTNDPYSKKGGTKTFQIQVADDYKTWAKTKTDPQGLFNLIVRALSHGMVYDAVAWSKELDELYERTKPQLSARVAAFLKAYRDIKASLDKFPDQKNDAKDWQETVNEVYNGTKLTQDRAKHYSIISWDANDAVLNARATRLEDNFKAFYLWHATQGISLKPPSQQQIVVLLRGADEFSKLRLAFAGRDPKANQYRSIDDDFYAARHDFAGLPPLTDAFLAPHYNIMVMSPERIDGVGRSFRMSNRTLYQGGMTRELLLTGGGPALTDPMMNPMGVNPLNPVGPGGRPGGGEGPAGAGQPMPKNGPITRSPNEVAQAQTTAFVERFDEDASEIAAVSCEGSRQLLFASDMLPEHVDLPIWLTTGAGEFYMRPRNPVYTPTGENKATMAIGLTTGYGQANFAMQYRFAQLIGDKDYKVAPPQLLKNVLTDSYFLAASTGTDLDTPTNTPKTGLEEVKRIEALKMKARVLSWAAYYDLMKNQPSETQAYMNELKRLPRDVAIDRHTHLMLFARSFRLLDDKGNLDETVFAAFAQNWLTRVRQVNPTWVEVEVTTPALGVGSGGTGPGASPIIPVGPRPGGG